MWSSDTPMVWMSTLLIRSEQEATFEDLTARSAAEEVTISPSIRSQLANALGGSFKVMLTNRLPLSLSVQLVIGTASDKLYEDAGALRLPRQGTIPIDAAPVDPTTGLVKEAIVKEEQLNLTVADAALLSRTPLFLQLVVSTRETSGQKVRIVDSDFVKAAVDAVVRVKKN